MVDIRITDVQIENGGIATVHFDCERMKLRDVVDKVSEELLGMPGIDKAKPIRREKDNPVIKTNRSDRVYFKFEDGSVRANLGMADDDVVDVVTVVLMNMSTSDFWDMVPFPEDRFTQYSQTLIEDKDEERPRETQGSSFDEVEDAYEDLDHVDEAWNTMSESVQQDEESVEAVEFDSEFEDESDGEDFMDETEPEEDYTDTGTSPETTPERERRQPVEGEETTIIPPYTKDEANYHGPAEGPKPHLDCKDCVHYVSGGGCQVVQGEVDPDGYCEDLFADFGVFGNMDNTTVDINLSVWGEMFEDRLRNVSINEIADKVKETIRRKLQW